MRSLEIDAYANLDSLLHAWDPRVKIFSLFLLLCTVVIQEEIWAAGAGLLLAVCLLLLSRVPLSFLWKRARWILLIFLLFFILLPLTVPGKKPLLSLSFCTVSKEGLLLALKLALRGIGAVLIMLVILTTARFDVNIKAMAFFRIPNKMIQLFLFTYRYIFVLANEYSRMISAARQRGFRGTFRLRTLRSAGNMVGMLFVRTLERSERIYQAMICRGYQGELITLHSFYARPKDYFLGGLFLLAAAGFALLRLQ